MRTFVMIKPDGVKRGLVGEIVSRFERYGIRLAGLRVIQMGKDKAERLYAVHKGKPFYNDLMKYITSGPVAVLALEIDLPAEDAIKLVRKVVGATNPLNAEMGSIRGDYGMVVSENIIHASDGKESADYELPIFFNEQDLVNY
ncbi:MAG: nucleoside-diphosphate kinase [Candidatus Altiarchaeia archaeon]